MKKYIYRITLLSIIILLVSCKNKTSKDQEENHEISDESNVKLTNAQLDQTEIIVGKAQKRKMGIELSINGMINVPPQGNISITVPYGGFLKFTNMLPGTRVKKGQLIAKIENPEFIEFQREYMEAVAKNDYLEADFERQKILFKEAVSSKKVYQQAKSLFLINASNIHTFESKLKLVGIDIEKVKKGEIITTVNVYSPNIQEETLVLKDAFVLLAKSKNKEEEHGH